LQQYLAKRKLKSMMVQCATGVEVSMGSDFSEAASSWGVNAQSAALHQRSVVWDNTVPWRDYGDPARREACLPRMKASGHDVVSLTLSGDRDSLPGTIHKIAKERDYFRRRSDEFIVVHSVADIERARVEDKLAVVFHFQGSNPVDNDPAMVELYYQLGIRHILLVYNLKNPVGDGCKERTDAGLSRFGETLVREMNRVGMQVDCSHTGYRTSMDVMETSEMPVIFSHSNALAMNDHPRNLRDDQIKACADTGGVIGINGVGLFLGNNDCSVENQLRHIDYMASLVGAEHLALGSDYTYHPEVTSPGPWNPPHTGDVPWSDIQYAPPEQTPKLTEALLARGYSEDDVSGILGGNWMRVARTVWK
jgi:membrane dipeptidase